MGAFTGMALYALSFAIMAVLVVIILLTSAFFWWHSDFDRFMHIFNFMVPFTKWGSVAIFTVLFLAAEQT